MKPLLLPLFAVFSLLLVAGCHREHVDGRRITSYSIEVKAEADLDVVEKEFQMFLDKLGMQQVTTVQTDEAGSDGEGEKTVKWLSRTDSYSLTITQVPNSKYQSGDIIWVFRGPSKDWAKLEIELQGFQEQVVEWFKKRPELLHKESSYWDGLM